MGITVTAGNSGAANNFSQRIENVRIFAGSTITISCYVKATSAASVGSQIVQSFGSGGSTTVVRGAGTFNFTTDWQRLSLTVDALSVLGKTLGTNHYLEIIWGLPVNQTRTYYFSEVQVEPGSIATDFEQRFPGEEFLLASRYFLPAGKGATGAVSSSSTVVLGLSFPQQMAQNPIISIRDTPAIWIIKSGAIINPSGTPSIVNVTPSNTGLTVTISGFSSLTANDAVVSTSNCFNVNADL